jgi:uncharacterized RDD family membrane protein YckC
MMLEEKQNALVIKTHEGIVFPLLLASPVTRFLAWVVDLACVSLLASIAQGILLLWGVISADLARGAAMLAYFVVSIGYGAVTEWYWRGQTVGKRLLRLRVMDEQGLRLQPSQIVVRNVLRAIDMLPAFYLVGGVACLISRRAQRLGDFAANTIVVRQPELLEPDIDQLMAGKFNSFREYPHLAARLRQRVLPHESAIALRALLRRDELDPRARVELFSEIVAHFRSIVEFPEEATFGLADEQYVRNVVDIIFRT